MAQQGVGVQLGSRGLLDFAALLWRARVPVGVRIMCAAEPLAAALAELLALLVAGLVHPGDALTELLFGSYGGSRHGFLLAQSGQPRGRRSASRYDDAHFVHTTAGNIHPPVKGCRHIADCTAAGRNVGAREGFRLGIEANQRIRLHARFAVPNHSVGSDGDAVGMGRGARWRIPQLYFACLWIEAAEVAPLV